MVLFIHAQHEVEQQLTLHGLGTWKAWEPVYWAGGVDIFFVISGFIMYRTTRGKFGTARAARDFLLRRIERVVPLYWLFSALGLLAMLLAGSVMRLHAIDPVHVAASFLFFPTTNADGRYYPLLILGWTLNYELMFYALFAMGMRFPERAGLALIGASLVALATATLAYDHLVGPFRFWCSPIVTEFGMGVALGYLHARGLRLPPALRVGLILLGILAMVALKAHGVAGAYWQFRPLWMGLPALAIAAASVLGADLSPSRARTASLHVGDAAYALYLSHPFTINGAIIGLRALGLRSPWLLVGTACVASLVTGSLVHLWIEKAISNHLMMHRARRSLHVEGLHAE
jgi:peptidoglycan/LPS O-acetylase OafA/YrhL